MTTSRPCIGLIKIEPKRRFIVTCFPIILEFCRHLDITSSESHVRMPKRHKRFDIWFCRFEHLRDLTRRFMRYWKGPWCPMRDWHQIDGLVQDRRNSSALTMEFRLSCTNPPKCSRQIFFLPEICWLLRFSTTNGQAVGLGCHDAHVTSL